MKKLSSQVIIRAYALWLEHATYKQIGEILGLPLSTAFRAAQTLQAALQTAVTDLGTDMGAAPQNADAGVPLGQQIFDGLGCGYEHSCSTKGCAILRQAAEALEQQSLEMEGMRSAANSLKMHLEKATAERDAAVRDMHQNAKCFVCANLPEDRNMEHCMHYSSCGLNYMHWVWRGLQKEG